MNLLSVNDLSIGYKRKNIQSSLSFDLNEGELLWIKGDNGSGKSTLVKTLLGQLKPLSGRFKWNLPHKEIGFLPQTLEQQLSIPLTIGEVLSSYENETFSDIELIDKTKMNIPFNKASGGEKQRTLISLEVLKGKKVLVLDEPLNHLDQTSRKAVWALVMKLMKDKLVSGFVIISHIKPETDHVFNLKEVTLS